MKKCVSFFRRDEQQLGPVRATAGSSTVLEMISNNAAGARVRKVDVDLRLFVTVACGTHKSCMYHHYICPKLPWIMTIDV